MKKLKIKKKKKILYLGYKEYKLLSEQGILKNDKNHYNHGVLARRREKNLSRIPKLKKVQLIAVASLDNECGCSFISQALANYISGKANGSVGIIDITKEMKNNSNTSMLTSKELIEKYHNYHYIIIDLGNLSHRSDSDKVLYKDANIKVMISIMEDYYLRQLAAFIRGDKRQAVKNIYLFNLVPQEKKKKIQKLMEGYKHYCLPIINKDKLSYDAQKIFHSILVRR